MALHFALARTRRSLPRFALAALLGAPATAQEPLFTMVSTSDSQAGSEAEWQGFEDVLETIATAGEAGALLPRSIDLVLFAGDITLHDDVDEWVRSRGLLDTWLTANDIPFLCVPGNHDHSGATVARYEQFIASAAVWEASSAAFTGHNGRSRSTGWTGLRFIGFDNSSESSSAWNTVSSGDLALIQSRVSAAAAAHENVFLVAHHPHDGQDRIPLASVLPNPAIVGYVRGHSGSPHAQDGLSGINNPNVWDLNTNAIVDDRDLIYYEVFANEIRAYVLVLDDNPTRLPTPAILSLPFPLTTATVADRGHEDASHASARPWPSATAPERKLWFQGGSWWGVLWHEPALAYRIQRFDTATQTWVDTGPSVSSDPQRGFDALADGTKLYLTSHVVSVPSATGAGAGGTLQRFSFDAAQRRYTLDAGFPVAVDDARTRTLCLAKDSTGTLWATWAHANNVRVNRTVNGDDATWAGPITVPFPSARALDPTDASGVVAFDGKIGIAWSNRVAGTLQLAVRNDVAAPTTWTLETIATQPGQLGDGFDLAESGGRVLLASTTSAGGLRLWVRSVAAPGLGAWSVRDVSDTAAALKYPLVVVDQTNALVRLFATGPLASGGNALGAGAIWEKDSPLATLAFPSGRGTAVIQDSSEPAVGFATASHQSVSATSGLVVLASNELTQRAWHAHDVVGTPPAPPDANFSGTPLSGVAPLLVRFTDSSTGVPTTWAWSFGDGTSASTPSPEHVYAQPGTYNVTLTVSNGGGSDTRVRNGYVVATAPPQPTVTLRPSADAGVSEASLNSNFGMAPTLRVRVAGGGGSLRDFLRFDVPAGPTPSAAKLRLFVLDPGSDGGRVYKTSTSWTETGITWANQPSLPASSVASIGSVANGTWKEIDVSAAVTATGALALELAGGSSDLVQYSSREGANPPELVLTYPAPLVAGGAPRERSDDATTGATATQVFTAVADARVDETGAFASAEELGAGAHSGRSYVKFDCATLEGRPVSARLRLFVTDPSVSGGVLARVSNRWEEATLTSSAEPRVPALPLATAAAATAGAWVEFDVTPAVLGAGTFSFALTQSVNDAVAYSSREGGHPPELVVETAGY